MFLLRQIVLALETSLVEWKQPMDLTASSTQFFLGNFLSGMETFKLEDSRGRVSLLGNFLSGMETFLQLPTDLVQLRPLETSLVEWKQTGDERFDRYQEALETSLVEWKLRGNVALFHESEALETSLVEWKRRMPAGNCTIVRPWKLP